VLSEAAASGRPEDVDLVVARATLRTLGAGRGPSLQRQLRAARDLLLDLDVGRPGGLPDTPLLNFVRFLVEVSTCAWQPPARGKASSCRVRTMPVVGCFASEDGGSRGGWRCGAHQVWGPARQHLLGVHLGPRFSCAGQQCGFVGNALFTRSREAFRLLPLPAVRGPTKRGALRGITRGRVASQALERESPELVRLLRQEYEPSLRRDALLLPLLDGIEEAYLGVRRGQGMGALLSDIFGMLGGEQGDS
jgi:Golgi to ER traffic protein 4